MKGILIAAAMLMATPAMAQGEGGKLWQNVNVGMTTAQVQALYPAENGRVRWAGDRVIISDAVQIGRCSRSARVMFARGIVKTVVIESGPDSGGLGGDNCANDLLQSLLAKYGPATTETITDKLQTRIWIVDGVAIRLENYTDPAWWYLHFDPAPRASGI